MYQAKIGLLGIVSCFCLAALLTSGHGAVAAGNIRSGLHPIKRVKRDGFEGGSFGGDEGGGGGDSSGGLIQSLLMQQLLSQMGGGAAAPAAPAAAANSDPAAPASPAAPSPSLMSILQLMSLMGGGDDDANAGQHQLPFLQVNNTIMMDKVQELSISQSQMRRTCVQLEMCTDHLLFDAIAAYNATLFLAFHRDRVYFLSRSGELQPPFVYSLNALFPIYPPLKRITAVLPFRGDLYLFSDEKYAKFPLSGALPGKPKKSKVFGTDFPQIPIPIGAAFNLDDSSFIFVSGREYVQYTYQKENIPSIKSSITPDSIFLTNLTTAFTMFHESRVHRFLVSGKIDTMYEIDAKFQVMQVTPFTRTSGDKAGWLMCPDWSTEDNKSKEYCSTINLNV